MIRNDNKISVIILAAGQGKRMQTDTPKQYLNILGKPMLYYSLLAFEQSEVDEVVLVVGSGEEEYCKREIVDKYGFVKVAAIVEGGAERYLSVIEGLNVLTDTSFVLIHDGARPLITTELITAIVSEVKQSKACILAVPSKDTVKIVNSDKQVENTPDRNMVYNVQTPQAFSYDLIKKAYDEIQIRTDVVVTDDAMVVETCTQFPIKVVESSYQNIKVTTPEDIQIAEVFLNRNR